MGRAFDPDATRSRLLGSELGLDWQVRSLVEADHQESPYVPRWPWAIGTVVEARIVGLAGDPRLDQILQLTIDRLAPLDWAAERSRAHDVSEACTALAVARWLRTGEPQTALFSEAYQSARDHLEDAYGKKTRWRFDVVRDVVALGCAGHRFAEVLALFERAPLAKYRTLDLARARTTVELGHAIALHRLQGMFTPEELAALAERTLRREVVTAIELTVRDLARLAYLVAMAKDDGGDPRALLDRMTEYVSYIPKPVRTGSSTVRRRAAAPPPPAPSGPRVPLPPIALSASPLEERAGSTARVSLAERPDQEWKELSGPDGPRWALRVSNRLDTTALVDPRWSDVVELNCENPALLTSPALRSLVRATPDGHVLSALADRSTPCPLEVAFPRTLGSNWIDGAMVQVSPPLTRGVWRRALAVGALQRLRAVSFSAVESDKIRIARGAQPYVVGPPWFWDSPLAQQLEGLDVSAELHALRSWRDRFDALPRLSRVYLRVSCGQRALPWPRPVRVVIDRAESRMKITLQCAVSLRDLLAADVAALFEGATRDDISVIEVERLGADVTDDSGPADLLGTEVPLGAVRGNARLAEL